MGIMNVVQATLILRNDLANSWILNNPTLAKGELGAEIDTGLLKLGDGISPFSELQYINVTPASLTQQLETKLNKVNPIVEGILTLNYSPINATDAVNKAYVDNAIHSASLLKREIVVELPPIASADENTIYMIRDSASFGPDHYKEYMLINNTWELIGDTSVNLDNYIPKPQTFISGNIPIFDTAGALIDSGFNPSEITIGIATETKIGGVLSSHDDNSISVMDNGKMTLNRVSTNNLFVPEEDELILMGGGALK